MSDTPQTQPPGWYYAQGDPPGTQRYWDGTQWQGGPQAVGASGEPGTPASTNTLNLASAGERIGARVIDIVIWTVIGLLVWIVFGGGGSLADSFQPSFVAGLIGALAVIAYEVMLVVKRGATVGKMVLGLSVVKEDGSPVDFAVSGKRMAIYAVGIIPYVGGIIQFVAGLAGLVMLFTDDKLQAPWDKLAKTVVIKK